MANRAATHSTDKKPATGIILRIGVVGGLLGGCIWIYEAVVWIWIQRLMPLAGIPRNATGLVFGKAFQESSGVFAYALGTAIHFGFATVWGVAFTIAWPWFRRRGWESTQVALPFAAALWIAMHAAISLATADHPNYLDANVVIGGFVSHLFYTVPLALYVKRRSGQRSVAPNGTQPPQPVGALTVEDN